MDVIPHAGAVRRRIIVAVNIERLAPTHRHLCDEGHEVVRHAARILADQPALVRTDGVEVAQQRDLPGRVGAKQILQDRLDHRLAAAVGVRRPQRVVLPHRHRVRIAVHRRRRAEDQPADAGRPHRRAQRQRAADVVVVILERPRDGFPLRLQAGEMQHCADGVFAEHRAQGCRVAHIAFVEGDRPAGDPLDPSTHLATAVAQIVDHHHAITGLQQFDTGMGTDVAGASRYQNLVCGFHKLIPSGGGDTPGRTASGVA
ncbi:MAG: hypothetical protein POELPBGB_04265 [Bacteroidia bacterium]|nr:hypothetical protein [Bacteroidia bacterium]